MAWEIAAQFVQLCISLRSWSMFAKQQLLQLKKFGDAGIEMKQLTLY